MAEPTYRTRQQFAYDEIRRRILTGQYKCGDRLIMEDLANELGVSRIPIREALRQMEVTGLVVTIPHRGTVVNELSVEEVVENFHIRAVLEGLAVRLACANMSEEDMTALDRLMEETEATVHQSDEDGAISAFLKLNRRFHSIIWMASDSPRLQKLLSNLYDASTRYRNMSLHLPGRLDELSQEHRRIVDAIRARDALSAERLMNEHYENTARWLLKYMEAQHRPNASETIEK